MKIHKTLKTTFSVYLILFFALGNLAGCTGSGSDSPDPVATAADDVSLDSKDTPIRLTDPVKASFVLDDFGVVDILGLSAEKETRELVLSCRFQGDEIPDVRTIRLGRAEVEPGWFGYLYAISLPGGDSWLTLTLELSLDGTMSRTRFRGPDEELTSTYTLSDDGSMSTAEYMIDGIPYARTVTAMDSSELLPSADQGVEQLAERYGASSLPGYESSAQMLSSLVHDSEFQQWLLGAAGRLLQRSPDSIESALGQLAGYGDDPGVRDMCGWASVAALCCSALVFVPCWVACIPGGFLSAACTFIFVFDQVNDWLDGIFGGD